MGQWISARKNLWWIELNSGTEMGKAIVIKDIPPSPYLEKACWARRSQKVSAKS